MFSAFKQAVHNKAVHPPWEASVKDAPTSVKEQEILAVPQAFANWLTGGSGVRSRSRDDKRQTVMKTVQQGLDPLKQGTGAVITIDPIPRLGQQKLIIVGDKEQRNKAKRMMQDLRTRGSMDSLEESAEAWGGVLSDPNSVSPNFQESSNTQRRVYRTWGRENVDSMSFDQMSPQTAFGGAQVSARDSPHVEESNPERIEGLSMANLRRKLRVWGHLDRVKREDEAQQGDVSPTRKPSAELTNQANQRRQLTKAGVLASTKEFRHCAADLEQVQRRFNTQDRSESIKHLMQISNRLSRLPASPEGIKALLGKKNTINPEQSDSMTRLPASPEGIEESDSAIDFACSYPDPGVRAAFASLIQQWKDVLAYIPDVAFDDTLNSFSQQSTAKVEIVGKPTMWREDRHGGAELSISKSSWGKWDNDEEERKRVAESLAALAPLISEVQLVSPDLIFFRMSDVDRFCEYMAANKIAQVRVRGPNNYVRLTIGTDAENDAFLAVVARLQMDPTLMQNSNMTLEDIGLKAIIGSAYL